MAEGARLESVYTVTPYRGFESLPLRQIQKGALRPFLYLEERDFESSILTRKFHQCSYCGRPRARPPRLSLGRSARRTDQVRLCAPRSRNPRMPYLGTPSLRTSGEICGLAGREIRYPRSAGFEPPSSGLLFFSKAYISWIKQRVIDSMPGLNENVRLTFFREGYPSGQRGQTVNLLAMPSEVRILPPPPFQISDVSTEMVAAG